MYDGELTGDLRAAGRSPPARSAPGHRRSPGMGCQLPQRDIADRHQLRGVIARASTPTPATKAPKAGPFFRSLSRKQPRAFAPRSAGTRCRPPRSSSGPDEAPGPGSMIRCASCRQPAAFAAGKCSKPADTRHRVPDADSDRARLPGTGPAPRLGASEDVPDQGAYPGTISAQTGPRW